MVMLGLSAPGVFGQNTVPTVLCQEPVTVECAPVDGALVTLTARVSDPQSDAVTLVWKVNDVHYQTNDITAGTLAGVDVTFTALFGEGTHEVRAVASDGQFLAECRTTVTVVMDGVPAITNLTATPSVLWPPNGRMRPIRLNIGLTNDCSSAVTSRVVSVTSSEPVRGTGAFDKGPDWVISRDGSLSLRAERSGRSRAGRTYTITVEVEDAGGNVVERTTTVTVPHDQGHGPFAGTKQTKKPKKAKKPNRRR